jgi:hypothetical protein
MGIRGIDGEEAVACMVVRELWRLVLGKGSLVRTGRGVEDADGGRERDVAGGAYMVS